MKLRNKYFSDLCPWASIDGRGIDQADTRWKVHQHSSDLAATHGWVVLMDAQEPQQDAKN
ncbi:hypothetical protein FRC03_008185 [Tulasnella sp. 419]|nr:hypothetical protein FRC03_008185 [Tulasnella sp. 419]